MNRIIFGDNLAALAQIPDESVDLIYIDPPFNTGRAQSRTRTKMSRDDDAPDRIGFKGRGYRTQVLGSQSFDDVFENFKRFIEPRFKEAYRVLKKNGSFFLHIDYREVHHCKTYLDDIFGPSSFINEIIWAYDYGARSKRRWSTKHDNILWYAKNPKDYTFNFDSIDRIPYLAPGLVGPAKAARGKTPTDVWWHTIVSPTGKEKTGYPTQKPLGIIERIVRLHSKPGDTVLDFFAGSGTVGEACGRQGREFILIDNNREAIEVMKCRLARFNPKIIIVPMKEKNTDSTTRVTSPTNVHIIAAAVWDYDDQSLRRLQGPKKDLDMVRELFSSRSPIGIYPDKQIEIFENPTLEELRSALVRYSMDRSAHGDILVFYFSGHGTVFGNNEFGFCVRDTRIRSDGGGCLPLSVLSFNAIVGTLAGTDIHPLFIIDACFSGKAGQNDQTRILKAIQDDIHREAASAYGLLCACYSDTQAHDTNEGGAFTKALYEVTKNGLKDKKYLRKKYLNVSVLSKPVQDRLTRDGSPLSKLYLGPDLPEFPLVQNMAYRPSKLSLTGFRRILEILWNNGKDQEMSIPDIGEKGGYGAYCNHSKLSCQPWNLVGDGKDGSHRRLTERGRQFMAGKIKIPNPIEKDPDTDEWRAAENAREITFSEIPSKTRPAKTTSKKRRR